MRGLILALAAMAGAVLLAGCAATSAGEVAGKAQGPAIAGLEAAVAGELGAAIDQVGRAPPTPGEARAMIDGAGKLMARVAMARLAWDATMGPDASETVLRQVAAARAATDQVYLELLDRLQPYASN